MGGTGSSTGGQPEGGAPVTSGTGSGGLPSGGAGGSDPITGGAPMGGEAGGPGAAPPGGEGGIESTGGQVGAAGEAGSPVGAGGEGGQADGGESGAPSGGMPVTGGTAGAATGGAGGGGQGGSAGVGCTSAVVDDAPVGDLASGMPALADDEQASSPAEDANDGSVDTKWKASDTALGHFWRVDLGAMHDLTGVRFVWEFQTNREYGFDIDVSNNDTNYQNALSDLVPGGVQSLNLSASGRYVRITITSITPTTDSASIKEINLCGQ